MGLHEVPSDVCLGEPSPYADEKFSYFTFSKVFGFFENVMS